MSRVRRAVDDLLAAISDLESRNTELRSEVLRLKAENKALRAGTQQAADPYTLLGLARGAGVDEIRAAYRAAVRGVHPDQQGDRSLFEALTEARDSLLSLARQ
jgi:uncharacterized small protein (DUF1192 family)